ncbi:MAG: TonB-dependent receptor domain-containing protein, partial [Myxococcota bacterium]
EFGGGTVEMRTRGIPEERVVSVGLKMGGALGSTFTEGLGYAGGPLDVTGFDGGARALPSDVQAASDGEPLLEGDRFSSRGYSAEELERLGEQMAPAGGLERSMYLPDGGFDFEIGDRFSLGNWDLGYRFGGGWSRRQRRLLEERSYYLLGQGGALELAHSYAFESGVKEMDTNALLILGGKAGQGVELGAMTFVGRMSDDEARIYEGLNRDVGAPIRVERLRWVERTLVAQQLLGRHKWSQLGDLALDWTYTYALALRGEPDRREVRYDNEPGTDRWLLSDRPEGNQRLFSDLLEHSHDLGVSLGMPFLQWNGEKAEWHVGAKASRRDRTVDTRRYKFMHKGPLSGNSDVLSRPASQVFTKETIGPEGFQFEEITRQTDNYSASQTTAGTFAHLDLPLWTGVRLDGGVRIEYAQQRVSTYELFNPDQIPVDATLETTDVLPAATLSLQLPLEMQLRLGGSLTVSRPDFRELSPATFNDVTGGRQIFGNPDLERSLISAADVRWEWYPASGTTLSTALFYKHFDRPIEQVVVLSAQQSVTFANAEAADNTGLEVEGRTELGWLHSALASWFVGGNAALIYSRVQVPSDGVQTSKERALQGQSPWVGNLQGGVDDDDLGAKLILLYNVFGPRISEVGAQGAPDVYEQPVHSVDVVFSQRLGNGFSLGAKAQNLLDAEVRYQQGDKQVASLRKGQAFSLSLTWDL